MSGGPQHVTARIRWRRAAAVLAASALLGAAPAALGGGAAVAAGNSADTPFPTDLPDAPKAYHGRATGCDLPDPTGTGGCVTRATAWELRAVEEAFGSLPVSCWDEHAWNPSSDHPRGKACDYTFGTLGEFPDAVDTAHGWLLATWLRKNADRLDVRYVIWQGQIWVQGDRHWRPYDGGGVYDPTDPTGGHYDHVHVSTRD